jgi:hypothetical protein
MAKFKFTDSRITEIVALLDKDAEGRYIITLDDEQFDFEQILNDHVGDNISVKFTRDIEE